MKRVPVCPPGILFVDLNNFRETNENATCPSMYLGFEPQAEENFKIMKRNYFGPEEQYSNQQKVGFKGLST